MPERRKLISVHRLSYLRNLLVKDSGAVVEVSTRTFGVRAAYAGMNHLGNRPDTSVKLKGTVAHCVLQPRGGNLACFAFLTIGVCGWPPGLDGSELVGGAKTINRVLGISSESSLSQCIRLGELYWLGHVLAHRTVPYFASLSRTGRSHVEVRRWHGSVEWGDVQQT